MKNLLRLLVASFALLAALAARAEEKAPAAKAAADVTGIWNFAVETGQGTGNPVFTFKQEGEKLTGHYRGTFGEAPVSGSLKDGEIRFSFKVSGEGQEFQCIYTGALDGDTVKGKVQFGGWGEGTFTGRKQPK